jgi:signal transduction histidine kinase
MKICEQLKDSLALSKAIINVGVSLNNLNRKEESVEMNKKALEIAYKTGDDYSIQLANINLSDYYLGRSDFKSALEYAKVSLKYALKINTPYDVADIKRTVGDLHLARGNYDSAEMFLMEALEMSTEIKSNEVTGFVYESLQRLYAKKGNFSKAYHYLDLARQVSDSVLGEKQIKTMNELEVKYETVQKDKQLAENRLQLEQNRQYIFYSIGISLIALLLAAIIFIYYYFKRKAYLKQIEAIEQEKELHILQALMEGEEKERTRIAHNLHDEVAGMLAAAKMHADTLSVGIKEITGTHNYHKIITLLDEASQSVRKTAHNLMPEVLIRFGLESALQRFCNNLSNDSLHIQFDSWGKIGRFPASFELSVYRIVQELLNNIIKHSKATEALLQMSMQEDVLCIAVEDNGVGFPKEQLFENGMGINSIRSRISAIKGRMDVNAAIGEGVSIYLEFETNAFTSKIS